MRNATLVAEASPVQRRSLFLYSPVGGGHLAASRALEDAWLARFTDWTAEKIDYLQFMPQWERRLWPGLYHLSLQYWPSLWRSYRRWTDRPTEPLFIRNRVTHVGVEAFASVLDAKQPRLVVSTIGGAAALAGAARARLRPAKDRAFLNALVASDFRAHHHWARSEADLFFVASDEAKADLVRHRIAVERIFVVGIPIRPALKPLGSTDRGRLRARLGLSEDPVLLISSGATGAYRSHQELLNALKRLNHSMDVVTFMGPPSAHVERVGKLRLFRLGFRDDFCDWLSASDLMVGKLGGHTAAEAFAAGVPIVVYQPIPGQEEDNAAWVVTKGAALWPRSRLALEQKLAELLHPDGRLERQRMAQAAARLARPQAASEIVRILAEALEGQA